MLVLGSVSYKLAFIRNPAGAFGWVAQRSCLRAAVFFYLLFRNRILASDLMFPARARQVLCTLAFTVTRLENAAKSK